MGNTYKKIELTGTSDKSIEDAVGIPVTGGPGGVLVHAVLVLAGLQQAHDVPAVEYPVQITIPKKCLGQLVYPLNKIILIEAIVFV